MLHRSVTDEGFVHSPAQWHQIFGPTVVTALMVSNHGAVMKPWLLKADGEPPLKVTGLRQHPSVHITGIVSNG
jgi:hypothetical protein